MDRKETQSTCTDFIWQALIAKIYQLRNTVYKIYTQVINETDGVPQEAGNLRYKSHHHRWLHSPCYQCLQTSLSICFLKQLKDNRTFPIKRWLMRTRCVLLWHIYVAFLKKLFWIPNAKIVTIRCEQIEHSPFIDLMKTEDVSQKKQMRANQYLQQI